MIENLLKLGGYALLAKEATDFVINSQHNREREQDRNQKICITSGLLIGVAMGVGVGMLFAPRAGKETRDMILDSTCNQIDRIQTGIAEGKKQINEVISKKKEEFCETTPEETTEEVSV